MELYFVNSWAWCESSVGCLAPAPFCFNVLNAEYIQRHAGKLSVDQTITLIQAICNCSPTNLKIKSQGTGDYALDSKVPSVLADLIQEQCKKASGEDLTGSIEVKVVEMLESSGITPSEAQKALALPSMIEIIKSVNLLFSSKQALGED